MGHLYHSYVSLPEAIVIWLVVTGTWLDYDFPFSWEESSSQLLRTPSFFEGVGGEKPPTSDIS